MRAVVEIWLESLIDNVTLQCNDFCAHQLCVTNFWKSLAQGFPGSQEMMWEGPTRRAAASTVSTQQHTHRTLVSLTSQLHRLSGSRWSLVVRNKGLGIHWPGIPCASRDV